MRYRVFHRTAAVVAVASALCHLLMLGHGNILWGLLMAAMAVVCFPCAGHLWRRPTISLWVVLGLMNAAMVAVHAMLWRMGDGGHVHTASGEAGPHAPGASGATHHGHEGFEISGIVSMDTVFVFATALAVLEVLLAAAALVVLTRRTSCVPHEHHHRLRSARQLP